MRDYGTGTWTGGEAACDHNPADPRGEYEANRARAAEKGYQGHGGWEGRASRSNGRSWCPRCGAQRVDDQLGLEATPDQYVERLVAVFREVRRVLRDDGTLWLNLGDSYISGQGGRQSSVGELPSTSRFDRPDPKPRPDLPNAPAGWAERAVTRRTYPGADSGYRPKDLAGMPWRVAFALQADGWYLRSDIIWSKPNPMPESVTDRPTKSHEYLFLFSKQARYFYDADAIREPAEYGYSETRRVANSNEKWKASVGDVSAAPTRQSNTVVPGDGTGGRNRRSVWVIPTEAFPEAHFATYPQALVQPCILAGTSEKGQCWECGAPWKRVPESETFAAAEVDHYKADASRKDGKRRLSGREWNRQATRGDLGGVGTRWEPSCACIEQALHDDPTDEQLVGRVQPQLVLDPFIGSGTTALVARKHGRRCIGIDLSAEYLAIAARRTQQLSLLGGAA